MQESQVIEKFSMGVGSTGAVPGDSVQSEQADFLATALLTDQYYVTADGVLVLRCIDERLATLIRALEALGLAPNAAGGTMTLTVADILIGGQITGTGTLLERHQRMINHLLGLGLPVGGHADDHDHAVDGGSGCGACDKISVIFAYMVEYLDELCDLAVSLGVDIDDEARDLIRQQLMDMPEFTRGKELLDAMMALPEGRVLIENMLGDHDALAAVLNFVFGTTLDRQALFDATGLHAFNVDVWAFVESAKLVYGVLEERSVRLAVIAMVIYNLATSAVLCSEEMRIVVRR